MNHAPHTLGPSGEPDAAEWFARLRRQPDDPQLQRDFQAWLTADPARSAQWDATCRTWDALGLAADHPALSEVRSGLKDDIAAARRPQPRWRWAAAIVGMIGAGGLATMLWTSTGSHRDSAPAATAPSAQASYSTIVGERRSITLADGSIATLSTDSRLRVTEWGERRALVLERGEAFFEVAKDPEHPFVVAVSGRTITALGTAFNVRLDPDRWSVGLLEGKVRVGDAEGGTSIDLLPGSRLEQREGAAWTLASADVAALSAWRTGSLVFDDQPLSVIVAELNRYSTQKVRIASKQVAATAMSGRFRTGDVTGFVSSLEAYGAARIVSRSPDEIVISAP
jgi:transmembrane sensor